MRTKGDEVEVFVNLAVRIEFSTKNTREREKEVMYICETASADQASCRGFDITSGLSAVIQMVHGMSGD